MISIKKIGNIDFDNKLRLLNYELSGKLQEEIADMSIKHFKAGFQYGGKQTDASAGGWVNKKDGSKSYLKRSGRLMNSIEKKRYGKSWRISSTVSYAEVHNSGGWTGRNLSTKMPKREFIGISKTLNYKVNRHIVKRMNQILKGRSF